VRHFLDSMRGLVFGFVGEVRLRDTGNMVRGFDRSLAAAAAGDIDGGRAGRVAFAWVNYEGAAAVGTRDVCARAAGPRCCASPRNAHQVEERSAGYSNELAQAQDRGGPLPNPD